MREKIIQTAAELFSKESIRPVTMDYIAGYMGISKRTIYENFRDKNDLLYNCILLSANENKTKILEVIAESENVIEALFNFGKLKEKAMKKMNPNFFEDLKKYHKTVYDKIRGKGEIRNYEISYTILKRGLNEGVFTKNINPDLANLFIHHTMDFFHDVSSESNGFCQKDFFQTIFLPYLRGICTDKGLKIIEKYYHNEN